jgi:hypothetical protein
MDAIANIRPAVLLDPNTFEISTKRLCRLEADEGELPDTTSSDRGSSKTYILTLNGSKFATRNKSDIAARERELGACFRQVEEGRFGYVMGNDCFLQTKEYRLTILQQGWIRAEFRH